MEQINVKTEEEFNKLIGGISPIFVKFYIEHCGGCLSLDKKLEENFKENEIKILSVNAHELPHLALRYQIKKVPLLIKIQNSGVGENFEMYDGQPFEVDKIKQFLTL